MLQWNSNVSMHTYVCVPTTNMQAVQHHNSQVYPLIPPMQNVITQTHTHVRTYTEVLHTYHPVGYEGED